MSLLLKFCAIAVQMYVPMSPIVVDGKDKVVLVCAINILTPTGSCCVLLSAPPPYLVQLVDRPTQEILDAMQRATQVNEAGSPSETVRFDWPIILASKTTNMLNNYKTIQY